jgi:hypothetical protein
MSGHIRRDIVLLMTPRDLREIADKMEIEYPKMKWGQDTCVRVWTLDPPTDYVRFCVDQSRYERQIAEQNKEGEK